MTVQIIHGDCRSAIEFMPSNSIHSIVTDPPYALVSISKRFGKEGAKPAAPGVYARSGAGFMGKTWDNGSTAFDPEFWFEALRVLKPGGHVLAFGGTRTYHRLASAIEDAGFEIRDQIGWLYGSGFPKSHNQDGEWEGWGTALKPAWEPIVVARKALDGTNTENLLRWGVGALNIDGCRVGDEGGTSKAGMAVGAPTVNTFGDGLNTARFGAPVEGLGRWPANVIHDGSDEVLDAFPSSNGSGTARTLKRSGGTRDGDWGMNAAEADEAPLRDAGTGSAARFFYCAKASKKDRDDGLDSEAIVSIFGAWESADQKVTLRVAMDTSPPRVIDVSGPSRNSVSEWNTLLFGNRRTGQSQMDSRSTTATKISSTIASKICASFLTFATSESTQAATLTQTELSGNLAGSAESIDLSLTTTSEKMASALGASPAQSPMRLKINVFVALAKSSHPTVKPTELMRYLCRLVTPPGGTVLDPFMGSGSTGRGAVLEGFNFIGCEMEAEYAAIARARIAAVEPHDGVFA